MRRSCRSSLLASHVQKAVVHDWIIVTFAIVCLFVVREVNGARGDFDDQGLTFSDICCLFDWCSLCC